jgi:flagellar assembly protein FliH
MSSKVLKCDASVEVRNFPWRGESSGPAAGLGLFHPRRAAAAPEVAPAPAVEPPIDLDAIRKQAFQEGLQAGREAAEKRLAEPAAKKTAELTKLLDELGGYKAALRSEAEAELVDLAFAVARRVLRRELSVDPGAVRALALSCLREFPAVGVKRVLVHPEDLALVRGALGSDIEAAADPCIARGGAVLETDQGRLDARIESQLEEIALGLADA